VEAVPGCSLPNGCFVGVRVGEVLKQGRYDPSCCYRFPATERQRSAKIDLYQHLGTCNAVVDPETNANNEVTISGSNTDGGELRLKVTTRTELSKAREERKVEVKKQAKDYLGRHCVEERLGNAVKALLAEQPENATEFLVAHLRESCPQKALDSTREAAPHAPTTAVERTPAGNMSSPSAQLPSPPVGIKAAIVPETAPSLPNIQPDGFSEAPATVQAKEAAAATKIQALKRGNDARHQVKDTKETAAATKIQALKRGNDARREVKDKASAQAVENIASDSSCPVAASTPLAKEAAASEEPNEKAKEEAAATKIQALKRGNDARREVKDKAAEGTSLTMLPGRLAVALDAALTSGSFKEALASVVAEKANS